MKFLFFSSLLLVSAAAAQQPMANTMPGMQMPSSSSSSQATNPPAGAEPDILAETAGRAPPPLDAVLPLARTHTPPLPAAQAAMAQSAGQAKQAGMLPNPVI